MVDNVAITAGTGTTIAADDVGGALHQRVKVTWGPDGTGNDADTATGKPLPVQLRGSDGTDRSNSLPITVASGGIASGAVASGAFASGALASGSIASGAIAAGAIAAGATSIADNEDAASADGDRGVKVLAVRKATPANTSGTDGDYEFLQMSAGRVWANSDISVGGTALVGGSGTTSSGTLRVVHATDDTLGGVVYAEDAASANADKGIMILGKRTDTLAATSGTDGDYEPLKMNSEGALWAIANGVGYTGGTIDVTRPADTTAYTANDVWANSTSSPTAGGFTITGAARKSGGSGILTDMFITSSAVPGTLLQGEIHLFNQAVTAVNDNAAWNLSDSDAKFRVGVVSFTLVADANNSYYHAANLNYSFVCVGTANLRYLIKVKNAYTPTSGEVLTILPKIIYID